MADPKQLEILKQGVEVWNEWRSENLGVSVDLSRADLSGADLWRADLLGANLSDANLKYAILLRANLRQANLNTANLLGANLREASLWGANLIQANLSEADLVQADLWKAKLEGANLSKADLLRANLSEADLGNANLEFAHLVLADLTEARLVKVKFKGAKCGYTNFGLTDLSELIDMDLVRHDMPSLFGMATLRLSKGKIPEAFLRGCGLSNLEIEFAKLMNPGLDPEQVNNITYKIHQLYHGGSIQYYSCFISHSHNDEEFAKRLHDDLQDNGVRCWFAPEDFKIGDEIRPTIDSQIRRRDKLLVILSENSVKSEWVGDEVEAALEEESKSSRLVLFPIRLDDAVMQMREDWAAKIRRRRHIGDFSGWKDKGSYQKAFERLLRDLTPASDTLAEEGGQVNGE